ncbi:hypothetical protein C7974DRAFT_58883 [Boeremia exigua]|uniref:uncharacterized protein n=1 Tax=Boeremia exigua TaxID=749465 RepID=UPI001E8CB648|nr:uncharacterized protein C7974DRAFT_58883 [Boeremia exigua]KAH6615088.1 hypothetical protein C7974DRAFT_58883 [Boeremia exigua]
MPSTDYYGNRFGRRFRPFNLRLRFRKRTHAPLDSINSNAILPEASDEKEREDPQIKVDINAIRSSEGGAEASYHPLSPASILTQRRIEQTVTRVQLENLLREQAILMLYSSLRLTRSTNRDTDLVSLVYADNQLPAHRFDVCTTSTTEAVLQGNPSKIYITRAIMHTGMPTLSWRVIKTGTGSFPTLVESLEDFIHELRRDLGIRAAGHAPGQSWLGTQN